MSRAITSDDIDRLERQVRQLTTLHAASTAAVGHEQRLTAEAGLVGLEVKLGELSAQLHDALQAAIEGLEASVKQLDARVAVLETRHTEENSAELFERVEPIVLPGNEMVQLVGGGDGGTSS